ncbi:uncharacterized protein LOC125225699 [Leguminivora glycinivorella]|uniref:uncharacterized protein LOC125225699 n=1 Tax=Leguminivora glycinivorella TaxID=1035111 RepID=UPI00200F17C5|nr:uncharacterized protein LOC125225699 [Leguminivora glycinivorella]
MLGSMKSYTNCLVAVLLTLYGVGGAENGTEAVTEVSEARGPVKYALLSHFAYTVVTKLVILKIVYGFILAALLFKGWKFVLWFIHYLKETKRDHHIEIDHDYHDFDHHGHHGFSHHDFGHHYDHHVFKHHELDYDPYQGYSSYGNDEYYPQKKKGMYDADGSYSVKGS